MWLSHPEAAPEIADHDMPCELGLSQKIWNILGTALVQLQVLAQDPGDCGDGEPCGCREAWQCHPAVLHDDGFHSPDVGSGSACLWLGSSVKIHNLCSASSELFHPMVNSGVTETSLTKSQGESSLCLLKIPAQLRGKPDAHPLYKSRSEARTPLHSSSKMFQTMCTL